MNEYEELLIDIMDNLQCRIETTQRTLDNFNMNEKQKTILETRKDTLEEVMRMIKSYKNSIE